MCEDVVYLLIVLCAKILEFIVYCVFVCWIVSIEKRYKVFKINLLYIVDFVIVVVDVDVLHVCVKVDVGVGVLVPVHIISYQTLFQYHTTKQTSTKNTTWYWGHDLKAKKAWDNLALNKGFIKYTDTFKTKKTVVSEYNHTLSTCNHCCN